MNFESDKKNADSTHESAEILGSNRSSFFPTPWLAFYSLILFLGGLGLLVVASVPSIEFRGLMVGVALTALLAGVLLWLKRRIGLIGYLIISIATIGFSGYRCFMEGYSTSRMAMVIGGLLMLSGYSTVVEELSQSPQSSSASD